MWINTMADFRRKMGKLSGFCTTNVENSVSNHHSVFQAEDLEISYHKSHFLLGKLTFSTAIFNSYVKLPEGKWPYTPIEPAFSYGFPMVFLSFSYGFLRFSRSLRPSIAVTIREVRWRKRQDVPEKLRNGHWQVLTADGFPTGGAGDFGDLMGRP